MTAEPSWQPRIGEGVRAPLYERLVAALAEDIAGGVLAPGDRLPAHRDLARRLGISVGTVTRAYAALERQGLVHAVHGRGTFVSGAGSADEAVEVIDLSVNVPPPKLAERTLASALAELPGSLSTAEMFTYPDPLGAPRHRHAIAAWLRAQGVNASPDHVLITHGAQHALTVAFAAASESGGTVLADPHTYPGALVAAQHAGLRVLPVNNDGAGMDPRALDAALRQTASAPARIVYLMPTLHNPYGTTLSQRRRREIAAVCRRRGAIIVEDDVYSVFRSARTTPLAALVPERTWYVNGFSKSLSPGLRVGALVAPGQNRAQAQAVLQATTLAVSPLMAQLVSQWILDGTAAGVAAALRAESEERLRIAAAVLSAHMDAVPAAGFHFWLPMPRAQAEQTFQLAAGQGLLLTPPAATLSNPDSDRAGLRVCIGRPPLRQLERALHRLRAVLRRVSPTGPDAAIRSSRSPQARTR